MADIQQKKVIQKNALKSNLDAPLSHRPSLSDSFRILFQESAVMLHMHISKESPKLYFKKRLKQYSSCNMSGSQTNVDA